MGSECLCEYYISETTPLFAHAWLQRTSAPLPGSKMFGSNASRALGVAQTSLFRGLLRVQQGYNRADQARAELGQEPMTSSRRLPNHAHTFRSALDVEILGAQS